MTVLQKMKKQGKSAFFFKNFQQVTDRQWEFRISKLEGDAQICARLREIGLRSGLLIRYLGRAPFAGPLYLQFKDSCWALRQDEAECIHIEGIRSEGDFL